MRVPLRLFRQENGVTAIEFALIAPVLFLLLFGILEFSLIMFASSVIEGATAHISRMSKTGAERSQAATPAARSQEDLARLRQMILERGGGLIRDDYLSVQTRPQGSPVGTVGKAGEKVAYVVHYDWHVFTPFLGSIIGDDDGIFPISSMTVVVNEPFEDD